jgi:hypothetical protein
MLICVLAISFFSSLPLLNIAVAFVLGKIKNRTFMSSGSYQGGTVSQPSPWLCIIVHIYPIDNKHIET